MAKLIQETGGGSRTVRRADGRMDFYGRTAAWRVRYVIVFPDGSRAIRSKVVGRRNEALALRNEAGRLERLTRTGMVAQQDLGHFLSLGFISRDDYLRLVGVNLDLSWDEVRAQTLGGPAPSHDAPSPRSKQHCPAPSSSSAYSPCPSHVGIYIGEGNFIPPLGRWQSHDLTDPYYASKYLGARWLLNP